MIDGLKEIDALAYLSKERQRALEEASELLWENVERSLWWNNHKIYAEKEAVEEKIHILQHHWHPVFVSFQTCLIGTIQKLAPDEVHEILLYGAGRRVRSIYKALKTISSIAVHGRKEVMSKDESTALGDALLLFYVHIVGFFDALAIAYHRILADPEKYPEKAADLLNKNFRKKLGLQHLNSVFAENDDWFRRVKEDMRNRYVHRVPPYVAPSALSPDEAKKNAQLDKEIWKAVSSGDFEESDRLQAEQKSLGSFMHSFRSRKAMNTCQSPRLFSVML